MRLLIRLIVLTLCISVLLLGCEKVVKQPITGIVTPTQDSLEKAQTAMERVNERRTEAHQQAEESENFSTIFAASENIFKEELGFSKGFWVNLVEIYRQENVENPEMLAGLEHLEDAFVEKLNKDTFGMFYFEYIRTFDVLIIEYLCLSYEFPEKTEEERLVLFRESVQDGEIAIIFL